MVFGAILGVGLGVIGGVTIGSLIFSSKDPKCFAHLDEAADNIEAGGKNAQPLKGDIKNILELAPHWIKWPDYERVAWVNRMIAALWPHYNAATRDIVFTTVMPILEQTCQQIKMLECIEIEEIDLGARPLKIGGIKTYETKDDEVIIEAPILWGSDCNIRVSVTVKIGFLMIYIPVVLKDLQLHAVARITFRPLVETLPCLGAIQISLINPPHLDMDLRLINNIDLMALPGIKEIAHTTIQKIIAGILLYPKKLPFDIMENGGRPHLPAGMLRVKLVQLEDLKRGDLFVKYDLYCLIEVHENRPVRSKTVKSEDNPKFEEDFHLIVDNVELDKVKVTVMGEDFGWHEDMAGYAEFQLNELECTEKPREVQKVTWNLYKDHDKNLFFSKGGVKKLASFMGTSKKTLDTTAISEKKTNGRVMLELTYFPFFRPNEENDEESSDEEEGPKPTQSSVAQAPIKFGLGSSENHNNNNSIRDDLKGLLTVTLTRCMHLAGKNTYVVFSLHDRVNQKTEEQKSTYVLNDSNPRWGDKFDFVMINADSILTVTVVEKPGIMESMMTMKFVKKGDDSPIGKIRLCVKDVVRNGQLKDIWALQEIQQGEISLSLTWTTCEFA